MARDDFVEVELEILKINPDSIKVTDGHITTVLPKSQLEEKEPYDFKQGDVVELHLPEWLATDRKLI